MNKLLLIATIVLTTTSAKAEDEVTNCVIYKTITFCLNTTKVSDSSSRTSAQILRTSGILRESDFPKMPDIRALEFTSNNITDIEPRFFSKFPNLNKLIIGGNDRFPNVTRSLLKHCRNLVNLKIFFNYRLRIIEENVLRNFPNLEKLVIRSERMHHLKKHDLEIVTNLRVLKLELTTVKKIDANAFEPIGKLEKLSLMANNFLKINTEIFDSITKLTELNLIYAEITDLSFLKKLTKLQIVQLAGNKINMVSADTFKGLSELRQIDLSHTGISHIDASDNFFQNVPKLEKIDLTCHNLTQELYDVVKFYDHGVTVIDKYADSEIKGLTC